jgi:hypothetical protein
VPQYNSDSTANGTITGLINGFNAAFTLSATPAVTTSLILMVNGRPRRKISTSFVWVIQEMR